MGIINPAQLQRLLVLDQSEKVMRRLIEHSDAPFLGLFGQVFDQNPSMRNAVEEAICANPTLQGYVGHLQKRPALFSVWLVWHVMKGMGLDGHFSLYPHVAAALGMAREPSQGEREPLWRAFRQAVVQLGLDPSPVRSGPHFMANEYLRQVGVPLAWADDLARKMLSFARHAGLPDDDDPEGIAGWQSALDEKLGFPFSQTARKAVALDSLGYYTRVFLRMRNAGGQVADAANALEVAMGSAFSPLDSGREAFRRAVLPYVLLHDGILGVLLPGREDGGWVVTVDGEPRNYRASADDRYVPFASALPKDVEIRDSVGKQSQKLTLWEDERSNRLLVFAANGRLKGRAQLAQAEALMLPPGHYTIISRFEPAEVDVQEIQEQPRLVTFSTFLHPGATHALRNGPAQVALQAESLAFLNWDGDCRATRDGAEFFLDGLQLTVEIPPDWLVAGGRNFVVQLTATGLGAQLAIPIQTDERGIARVDVGADARRSGWTKGLTRLLAELRRPNEVRVLQRSAVLYWHGLLSIQEGLCFRCDELPANFESSTSENVKVSGAVLKPGSETGRLMRLVFNLGERRRQVLTWNVPGLFVEVESGLDGGQIQRVGRPIGSTEVVSITSAKQVLVTASESGALRLGDWSVQVDFAKRPLKTLSAAFLANQIKPGRNTLSYINGRTGIDVALLRLVQPRSVTSIKGEVKNGQFEVLLDMPEPLEALAVCAEDMLSGERLQMTLPANANEWAGEAFARARLIVLNAEGGDYRAYILFDLDRWPGGAWVFRFEGCVRGVWGQLENARQDVFGIGLVWDETRRSQRLEDFFAKLNGLDEPQALGTLTRVQEALRPCYALESWKSLNWLADAWHRLVARCKGREDEALTELADMAALRPPADASASWQLQLVVGAVLPRLYALPAKSYRRTHERPVPLLRALRAMASMENGFPSLFPILIHPVAAFGFANVAAMMGGAAPQGFDISRYAQAIGQVDSYEYLFQLDDDDFLPGPGDYLGPGHLRHALRDLEYRYKVSLEGNEIRRGRAIKIGQDALFRMPTLEDTGTPPNLKGQSPVVVPWPSSVELLDEEELQYHDNLRGITHLLAALAWACRLEARRPGTLSRFMDRLGKSNIAVDEPLSYLLQVGEALFAYYLLLWELVLMADFGPVVHRVSRAL